LAETIPDPAPAHPELRPVFEQFGGKEGIRLLMEEFMPILLDDTRIGSFFEHVDHERTKKHLAEQFCVILGGDCTYTGMDMILAHEGFEIRRADFNALIEDLQIAMARRGIPFRAQNKLLEKLAPMHRQIISETAE
jgi:hemoglobin